MANGKKPYLDPSLEVYRALVDSLAAIAPLEIDSVVKRPLMGLDFARPLGRYYPQSRTIVVSPYSSDPRRTLIHEAGHAMMFSNPDLFYEWFSSTDRGRKGKEPSKRDMERFADDVVKAFNFRSSRTPSGVALIRQALLSRLSSSLASR